MPASAHDRSAGLVLAVDGPSGSGKSSVCREVATRLGMRYLDTGAMYRALTWWVLECGLDPADPSAQATVGQMAADLSLDMGLVPSSTLLTLQGRDISAAIRQPRISAAVRS